MNKTFKVKLGGAEKAVTAEVVDKKIWFKMDDQVFSCDLFDLQDPAFKKTKSVSKSPDRVLAPMPGKVTKIFISENQTVQKGEALLVMEAMKMEYTLKADISATVEKIFSKVGDQITLGYLLVQLKEHK